MILLCILCVLSAVYLLCTHYSQIRNCVLAVYSLHADSKLCPTVYLLCTHYMQG